MELCPDCNVIMFDVSTRSADESKVCLHGKICPACGSLYVAEDIITVTVSQDFTISVKKENPLPNVRVLKNGKVKVYWEPKNIDKNQ